VRFNLADKDWLIANYLKLSCSGVSRA